jgi:hypothetical protein
MLNGAGRKASFVNRKLQECICLGGKGPLYYRLLQSTEQPHPVRCMEHELPFADMKAGG